MNIISKFKLFEGKDFESIKIGDISLQDIYDYLYEDDKILYDLIKERGKITTFNTISKVCDEIHPLIVFSDLYENQLYSKRLFGKGNSQFSECFYIEMDIDISNDEFNKYKTPYSRRQEFRLHNEILKDIMLPIKNRFNFNIYYISNIENSIILLVPFS